MLSSCGIFLQIAYLYLMDSDLDIDLEEREARNQEKVRSCLLCQDDFVSSWPGERICKRCRSSSSWRNGY